MRKVTLLLLLVGAPALAQVPPVPPPQFEIQPSGPKKFAQIDTATVRFADGSETPGPELKRGDPVEVVLEKEERVRIKVGTAYGWVPASALGDAPPADDAAGAEAAPATP